ncbi:hypothetical protein [Nitratifractor sp.]|uniref:hypothetical protein n=1 Tax=Nitratifractor sp. TaxID=2268144 RepID=UPI0025D1D9F3|nr:hypothetical protein [Nitratifractor sp.]
MTKHEEELQDQIARQVSELIHENIDIDLKILRFLREDFDRFVELARSKELSYLSLVPITLGGIKKALVKDGRLGARKIRELLDRSETQLRGEAEGRDKA